MKGGRLLSIRFMRTTITICCVILLLAGFAANAEDSSVTEKNVSVKKCLLLMSYHRGYEWNDGIESGVMQKLTGVCQVKVIYLDTKRNNSPAYGKAAGKKAKEEIDEFDPDVLIASDDNATRYVVEPYYKNTVVPIVFCGINWTASAYGYPYKNATGMVEVAPIIPLFKNIQRTVGLVKKGVYLSSDVITEHKDFLRYKKEYNKRGVSLNPVFVSTMDEWKLAWLQAQTADFIIVNNNAGINDWDQAEVSRFVNANSQVLSVTNYQWMMHYAMLGMIKKPIEQGSWAGEVASAILNGLPVQEIPVTINKSWSSYINQDLLRAANISLSNRILNHAYKSW